MGDVEYDVASDPATRIIARVLKTGGSLVVCCIAPPSFEFGDARALGCWWIRGLAGKVGETACVLGDWEDGYLRQVGTVCVGVCGVEVRY